MSYAAVGTTTGTGGTSPQASFSLTTSGVGNFVLCEVIGQQRVATALSSSNCTWSALGTPATAANASFSGTRAQVFLGVVTSASTQTVTITWTGTAAGFEGCAHQEFSTDTGTPVLDKQGTLDIATSNTTWVSLTPAAAGEAYFGYAFNTGAATGGSTSGYTYAANADANGNGGAYNPACGASATAPVWGDSGESFGIMVLVKPVPGPPPPRPPSPVQQLPPGWFPGADRVTTQPGGVPFLPQPAPADATPAVIFPPVPDPAPATVHPPGWFPGADRVTAVPGGIPFTQLPPPQTATQPVIFPVPEVAGMPDWLPLPPGWFPGASQVTTDPGSIPFYSLPQPQIPPPAPTSPPFLTSIAGTGTTQYLADQYGKPFLVRGDSIWGLITMAGNGSGTTWQSDIDLYMGTRRAQGFNVALVDAMTTTTEGLNVPNANGNTWDGVPPWSGGVIGNLNPAYWARVDYAIRSAAANGITVFFVLADFHVFIGGAMEGMSGTQATTYGTTLAARYGAAPNLVWLFGNDYNDGQAVAYANIIAALRAGGDTHLATIENQTEGDSRFSDQAGTSWSWGTSNAQFNFVYTYCGNYPCLNYAYAEASPLCVLLGDGWYDGGGSTTVPAADRDFMRQQAWWTLSSGSRGYMHGDEALISWNPPTRLTTVPFAATDLNLIWNAYQSWTGWHQLVPDTAGTLVTGNRGTPLGLAATNISVEYTGQATDFGGGPNYYVTASAVGLPSASLAVLYLPDATGGHTGGAVTIDESKMAAGYTATWVDPANGATVTATTGSAYSRSTANSQGGADWVLVLQGPAGASANVTGVAAAVTVQGGAGVPAASANITGTAASVTVASPAGVFAGSANVTGIGAPVTVASPAGVPSSGSTLTGIGAPVTVASPAGTPSAAANVTGIAALVTVQGGAGVAFGGTSGAANVTGVAALVTVAGGAGTLSAGGNVTGTGAPVTVQGGAGTLASSGNVAGAGALVTVAGPAGAPSSSASVTGIGAPVTVAGGAGVAFGGTSGAANVTGIAAPVAVAAAAGTPHSGSAVTGIAAPVTAAGGQGAANVPVNVTGIGARVTVAAPAGTLSAAANTAGVAALAALAGGTGALAAAANTAGVAAFVTVASGAGSATSLVAASSVSSVTALDTSTATVTDPRDGTATVS